MKARFATSPKREASREPRSGFGGFAAALALLATSATLGAGLAGCTAKPGPPTAEVIVLHPPPPSRVVPDSVASAPAVAILRDTAALERQARRYVGRPDSSPEVINQLSTLLLQTRSAVGRMARNRTAAGYRGSDLVAARVAADGLAAFLQTRTSPLAVSPKRGASREPLRGSGEFAAEAPTASAAATPVPVAPARRLAGDKAAPQPRANGEGSGESRSNSRDVSQQSLHDSATPRPPVAVEEPAQ